MLAEWRVAIYKLLARLMILLNSDNEVCLIKVYARAAVVGAGVVELLLSKLIEKERLLCKRHHRQSLCTALYRQRVLKGLNDRCCLYTTETGTRCCEESNK